MNIHRQKFEDRFSPVCSIEGDQGPSGGDGGGGGGGSGGDAGPAAASGAESLPGGGGAQPAEAQHYFPGQQTSSTQDAGRVRSILDQETDPDHRLTMDDISALLSWSPPLGNKATKGAPNGQPQSQPAAKAEGGTGEQPAVPAAQAAPAEGQEPKLDPNLKALVEKLDQLASTPAPTQTPQGGQQPQKEGPKDFYGTVVPEVQVAPQLVQALFNADNPEVATQAMNVLVKGIMNRVMHDTTQLMLAQQQRMMKVLPEIVQTHTAGQSNTQKFYSTYKELNKPGLQPLVNQAAQTLAAQYAAQGKPLEFNDDTMKAIADMVHDAVEKQFGMSLRPRVATPAAPQNPQTPPPAKPNGKANGTFFTPNGARPPAASGGPGGQSADLLKYVL